MVAFAFLVGTFLLGMFIAYFFTQRGRPPRVRSSIRKREGLEKGRFTRAEVAKHNRAEDLWVILKLRGTSEYRVFDLTSYVDEHPGGDGILNNAGGDSTEGFHGLQHPPRAFDLIDDFCIGTLEDP